MTDSIKCYVVSASNGDVVLKRPTTARHTALNVAAAVLMGSPKWADWSVSIVIESLTDAEFKAAKDHFDEVFAGEMIAKALETDLQDGAAGAAAGKAAAEQAVVDAKSQALMDQIWPAATMSEVTDALDKAYDQSHNDPTTDDDTDGDAA